MWFGDLALKKVIFYSKLLVYAIQRVIFYSTLLLYQRVWRCHGITN